MARYFYTIEGEPFCWSTAFPNKSSRCATSLKALQSIFKENLRELHRPHAVLHKPFKLTLTYYFPIPTVFARDVDKPGEIMRYDPALRSCDRFFYDCALLVLFNDDKYVCEMHSSKFFSDSPRTEIEIVTYD